jgi:RNA polymerase sigma factor (sigma-70 family)
MITGSLWVMLSRLRADAQVIEESWRVPDRFGEIFDRHVDEVFRFVARRVPRQDAADVTADVFVRAFRLRSRYDLARRSALPWLRGIARNVIGDHLRARRRTMAVSAAERHAEFETQSVNRLLASAASHHIVSAMEVLSPHERETFTLYALEGLSYTEISQRLGVAPGTVASRISRARRHIRESEPGLQRFNGESTVNWSSS